MRSLGSAFLKRIDCTSSKEAEGGIEPVLRSTDCGATLQAYSLAFVTITGRYPVEPASRSDIASSSRASDSEARIKSAAIRSSMDLSSSEAPRTMQNSDLSERGSN